MQIVFGKMEYDHALKCGIKSPSSKQELKKIYLNKHTKYQSVLAKVREELYGSLSDPSNPGSSAATDVEYYLADSTGLPVCEEGSITVQRDDGQDLKVPWTMANFMKAAGYRWQSKVRLFCVRKSPCNRAKEGDYMTQCACMHLCFSYMRGTYIATCTYTHKLYINYNKIDV